jgi:Xaa-Pro aminopeptidase
VNVRYLTGYTGTNGVCVVGEGLRVFFTDFRYVVQAERQVQGFDRERGKQDLLEEAAARLSGRVGFEDHHVTVRRHQRLGELVGEDVELVPAGRLVEGLRAVKDAAELDQIRAAAALAGEIFEGVAERGLAGRTEREVALELEAEMRRRGAEPSFPSIVAGGANGALPHAEPGDDPIERDTLVVVDLGCEIDGYCSDCTRTFATGTPPDDALAVYELVLETQVATLGEVRPGAAGRDVDAFARERISDGGHGERFGHGLGHGVGMVVHEGPTLSRLSEDTLAAGNVVTVEPGVYVPGEFGVRIEDLVVVGDDGPEVLTGFPKELTTVE